MNKRLFAAMSLWVLALGVPCLLPAQDSPDKEGAMRVPQLDRAAFVVTITDHNGKPIPAPTPGPGDKHAQQAKSPVAISVERFGDTQHNGNIFNDGSKADDWTVGKVMLIRNPYGNYINIFDIASYEFRGEPIIVTMKGQFDWVSPKTFVAKKQIGGHPANFFQRSPSSPEKVWIDPDSGLPVVYDDGVFLYRYTFGVSPASPLELPADYQAQIDMAKAVRMVPVLRSANP